MRDGPSIARVAALIGDQARAEVLSALLSDRSLTASELGALAGVGKATISAHLAKLLDARLITVKHQGRHRYFRLAGPSVAALLESLMGVAEETGAVRVRPGPKDGALRKARVCYDHLAGELGVFAFDGLMAVGALAEDQGALTVPTPAQAWWREFGVDLAAARVRRRAFCRACLDWSERRSHLAGAVGALFLGRLEALGWARRERDSRVIAFSAAGEKRLKALFAAPSPTR